MESVSKSTAPDDGSCASPPGETANVDGEIPMMPPSPTHNPKLLEELEQSSNRASAWFNKTRYQINDSSGKPQDIVTTVDSGSGHSMIDYRTVKLLGLKRRPTLTPHEFEGMFGGKEKATQYVEATIACDAIGLEPVDHAIYVVESDTIQGQLILGTKFIENNEILEKILEARKKHVNNLPPGVSAESLDLDEDNVIKAIFDRRPSSKKKKDQEKYQKGQAERTRTVDDILYLKGLQNPSAVSTGAGGSSNPSYPRTSTWGSTTMSVFSGIESVASTVATTVSSKSVATEVLDKGKSVDRHGGSA